MLKCKAPDEHCPNVHVLVGGLSHAARNKLISHQPSPPKAHKYGPALPELPHLARAALNFWRGAAQSVAASMAVGDTQSCRCIRSWVNTWGKVVEFQRP